MTISRINGNQRLSNTNLGDEQKSPDLDLINKVNDLNRLELEAFIAYVTVANRYINKTNYGCFFTSCHIEQTITEEDQKSYLLKIIPDITPAEIDQIISLCKHRYPLPFSKVAQYTARAEKLLTRLQLDPNNLDGLKMIEYLMEQRAARRGNKLHSSVYHLLFIFAKNTKYIEDEFGKNEKHLKDEFIEKRAKYLANLTLDCIKLKGLTIVDLALADSTLTSVGIVGTKFQNVTFSGINLEAASLVNVVMQNCIFINVSMKSASFSGDIDLQGIKFYRVEMVNVNALRVKVKMCGSTIDNSDFSKIIWTNADFSNSRSENTNFKGADLEASILDNIIWTNVNLVGTRLDRVSLENATIRLAFPKQITAYSLDIWFNHLNQRDEGSILTAIESIQNKYAELKLELMHQVIGWFNEHNVDISTIIDSLEILYNNEIYVNDEILRNFMFKGMLPCKFVKSSSKALRLSYIEVNFIDEYITNLFEEDKSSFVVEHSSLINQLIYYAQNDGGLKNFATKLKDIYLSSKPIQEILQLEGAENWFNLEQDFIFFERSEALIVSKYYIDKFLHYKKIDNSIDIEWTHLTHIKDNQVQEIGSINLGNLFKTFTLFNAPYIFAQNKAKFCRFLELLDLGDYHDNFVKATEAKRYHEQKLINEEIQERLNKKFKKFFVQSKDEEKGDSDNIASAVRLTESHFNAIIAKLEINNKSDEEQAAYFLCLATVFARYSSSSFFGEGNNSPESLRYYGLALLNKALELYSGVAGNQSVSWQNKFLGRHGEHPCTALLADVVTQRCLNEFPETAAEIIPTPWH